MQHTKEEALEAFRTLGNILEDVYGVERHELLSSSTITIPSDVFQTNLPPFSAIASYLSQAKTAKEIAKLLGRNKTFVKDSIREAEFDESGTKIPVDVFAGDLSVMESAAHYLAKLGKSNKEIAEELGRSASAVWTLLKRAEEKLGGEA